MATALAASNEYWQRTVLKHLGLGLDPDEDITPFRRSVVVHVFRPGRSPVKERWYRPESDVVAELAVRGYIDASGRELSLTDTGLTAAGVLWPRCVQVDSGTRFISGSDAYGVILGAFDEEGAQTVARLLEVQAWTKTSPPHRTPATTVRHVTEGCDSTTHPHSPSHMG